MNVSNSRAVLRQRSTAAMVAMMLLAATSAFAQPAKLSPRLITPQNSAIILIDHQPQMAFAVGSIDRGVLTNNVTGLAKAAKAFNVPTILTTVAASSFSGPLFPEVQAVFPNVKPIDRSTMNAWEDPGFYAAVKKLGKKKLIMAGLWTEVCVVMPVLSAIDEGYEVYVVTDASGGSSKEAHDMGVSRMVQAGAIPVTWMQVLLELQRDWGRQATYGATTGIAVQHAGAYGTGITYATSMFKAQEGGQKH